MPDPERPIDAMIATVRQEAEYLTKECEATAYFEGREHIAVARLPALRGALRVLEAAKAWANNCVAEPRYLIGDALALYSAVRGEPE